MDGRQIIKERVNLGAEICQRLKNIFHKDENWINCNPKITQLFTKFKQKLRICYPNEEEEVILKQARHWTDIDIKEALEL